MPRGLETVVRLPISLLCPKVQSISSSTEDGSGADSCDPNEAVDDDEGCGSVRYTVRECGFEKEEWLGRLVFDCLCGLMLLASVAVVLELEW